MKEKERRSTPENSGQVFDTEQQSHVTSELAVKLEQGTLSQPERAEIAQLLRSSNIIVSSSTHEIFSGPLPPAQLLNQYSPEAQQIILEMAQQEQSHSHEMRKTGLDGAIHKDRRGQYLGGLVALAGLGVAAILAPHSPVAATVIGTLDLFGVVALFVAPRVLERRKKRDNQ